jgi:pimeloyl-ACP methyl ester carboxylesterase
MSAWRIELADNDTGPADWRLPVLALHGAASSGTQWQGLSDYLRGHYRVVAPNLPGYGNTRRSGVRDLGELAASVVNGVAHRGPMHVVGHSHGAAVALEIAIQRPEFVRSLTLIEPAVYHLLRGGNAADLSLVQYLESLSDWMAASVAADHPAAGMRAYVDFWYGAGAWERTSSELRHSLAYDTERVSLDLATSLAQSWPENRCERVVCPTLAMMALESHAASLRVTEIVAGAIPGARLVMIPEAGHMAPLTDPHIIDPLIAAHLKFVDRFRPKIAASSWVQWQ